MAHTYAHAPEKNAMHYLVEAAIAAGHQVKAQCDGEIDYVGTDRDEAIAALEACDQMQLYIIITTEPHPGQIVTRSECALIVNGLANDEIVADYSPGSRGFIAATMDKYETEHGAP